MRFTFWGVRGSIPAPGKSTVKYGGNTSCIEIYVKDRDQVVILDAGTGIRELGNDLLTRFKLGSLSCNIFLTHTHWDHVQGFPFFAPAFIEGNNFNIYGPTTVMGNGGQKANLQLKDLFIEQMRYQYFPVKLDEMKAKSQFFEIKEGKYDIDGVSITVKNLNHPILCLGYRFSFGSQGDLTYCTDSEPYMNYFLSNVNDIPEDMFDPAVYEKLKSRINDPISIEKLNLCLQENMNIINFCKGSRALVYDSQYMRDEYIKKMSWGHSRVDDAVSIACKAGVEKLYLFHHDPTRSDGAVEDMLAYAREIAVSRFKNREIKIEAAAEGTAVEF